MIDTRPVGVFDSGLGGLTVVKELVKLLPHEDIIYLGDTARVPYGTRSREIVQKFSLEDASFLIKKDVKVVVIACNTASSLAGDFLKVKVQVPVFEVISEASSDAVNLTKNKKIGVIGTRGTIGSHAYRDSINLLDNTVYVTEVACPLFVPFIEEGEIKSKSLELVAHEYLKVFKGTGVDTMILGCTHYPIIKNIIENELSSEKMIFIDAGRSQAKVVADFLRKNNIMNPQKKLGDKKYYVTDLNDRFGVVAEMFLGDKIHGSLEKAFLDDK